MARDEAYRRSEQKIEAARRSRAKKLDLSCEYGNKKPKLTELPESLSQLTQLQSLDLGNNQLTALPEWLGQLTQLQKLNLSHNQLTALPEWLGQLTQLQKLNLSHNQLTALPEWLGQLTQLQDLNLVENQLTALLESLGQLTQLQRLNLSHNQLTALPESVGQLNQLRFLGLEFNRIEVLPESLGQLKQLHELWLGDNRLTYIPDSLGNLCSLEKLAVGKNQLKSIPASLGALTQLKEFWLQVGNEGNPVLALPECVRRMLKLEELGVADCGIATLPEWVGNLSALKRFLVSNNLLSDLPVSLARLQRLEELELVGNPLNPELDAAYKEGLDAVKRYLRAKAEAQVVLNEAKLIFVGEGGVGKSSLLGALRGEAWVENRDTTHGVETKVVKLTHPHNGKKLTMNAWDFGGQPLYRPTHQLFFTAPAVYLAVWDPRRGPKQCCVDEWIEMVKHRTYDDQRLEQRPRVLVVATNGGPKERRDHIDEEGLRKQFGPMIVGFHHVDSRTGYGVDELKRAIARTAGDLPCVGRSVAASWKRVLDAVRTRSEKNPYISYTQFESLCREQQVTGELVTTYAAMLNELGYLIHYSTDPGLRDTVILKADWLSKAISFVLEDKLVKEQSGLVDHERLGELWQDRARPEAERYPPAIHPIFLRLMEHFELSYRVILPEQNVAKSRAAAKTSTVEAGTSLISQLVPGARPRSLATEWPNELRIGDSQRVQMCRIVDKLTGQPAPAEGLLYRLIVRLHRYSLGRDNYPKSCHWQRGLLIDDGYNGRALIEEIGGDIHVTVRAAYPERLLHHLCAEVKWLVDNFWKGLRCQITVPCVPPCKASLEVEALIEARHENRPEYPCPVCRKWLKIDWLLTTAEPMPDIAVAVAEIKRGQGEIMMAVRNNYQSLSAQLRMLLSQTDEKFAGLMTALTDEAKGGPRLFSLHPVDPGFLDRPKWLCEKFQLILWCEHGRLPLPFLNKGDMSRGVYEFEIPRDWFVKAAPFLKTLTGVLSLALPVATSGLKLGMDEAAYKAMEKHLDFGQKCVESVLKGTEMAMDDVEKLEDIDIHLGKAIHAHGAMLRQLQVWLKEKDPGFGGLVRVQNKRQEFLWVHPQFEKEY